MGLIIPRSIDIEHIPLVSIVLHLIEESRSRLGHPTGDLEREDHLFASEYPLTHHELSDIFDRAPLVWCDHYHILDTMLHE